MELQTTPVNADFATSPQLLPAQMAAVAAAGFRSVINNRPDHEGGAEQPTSAEIAQAAEAAGLRYAYLPVVPSDIKPDEIAKMSELVTSLPGPVLAFCRSGARAAKLYQLASGG
jgi:uncharacterized protein (TIGR01244 family)